MTKETVGCFLLLLVLLALLTGSLCLILALETVAESSSGIYWNVHYPDSSVDFGDDDSGGHPDNRMSTTHHDTHFLDC